MRRIDPIELSRRLLEARSLAGLNQKQLAGGLKLKGINVSVSLLSSIEHQDADCAQIEKIIEAMAAHLEFDVPYSYDDADGDQEKEETSLEKPEQPTRDGQEEYLRFKMDDLTSSQLVALREKIDLELTNRRDREIYELRFELTARAARLGVTVQELVGGAVKASSQSTSATRRPPTKIYRSPDGEVWPGRGPTPRWLRQLIAEGKNKEDFLVAA
jgi:DNA-binding protein H-NS